LFFLLVLTIFIAYRYVGQGADDIKACKEFIYKLNFVNAIKKEENVIYKREEKINNKNFLVKNSVATKDYVLELDENNKVIGFIKKDIPKIVENKIDIDTAQKASEKYLASIYDESFELKSSSKNEKENYLPYYSYVYTKVEEGYPFYFEEIKMNISKKDGLLDGYSNSTLNTKYKEPVINISKEQAEEKATDYFLKYNSGVKRTNILKMVYADNNLEEKSNTISELCYMITVEGKDVNEVENEWKIFISADNGNVIKTLKDDSEKKARAQ